jgi:Rieske 2Fe-2S family protein
MGLRLVAIGPQTAFSRGDEEVASGVDDETPICPLDPDDLQRTLCPLREASMLPQRAYTDEAVFAFEQGHWFCVDWVCVGRASEVGDVGQWFVASVGASSVIVARGQDGALRAFHNVCRHRGTTLLSGSGRGAQIRCPYHAWSYDLGGRLKRAPGMRTVSGFDPEEHGLLPARLEIFGGFVFVSTAERGQSLLEWLDDLPAQFEGIALDRLVLGRRAETEVRANWKLLMENFAESYHFGAVHPGLQRRTPSDRAESLVSSGPWQGGWMPLRRGLETVSRDGKLHGRPLLRKSGAMTAGALDYVLFPNLFLSLQPDYLLVYRLSATAPDRTRVTFDVLFDPDAAMGGAVDAPDVYDFWASTNAEDFRVCERQQEGVRSPGFRPGRYAPSEEGTHEFDKIVAERYLDP